jgi:hypothetical protein
LSPNAKTLETMKVLVALVSPTVLVHTPPAFANSQQNSMNQMHVLAAVCSLEE